MTTSPAPFVRPDVRAFLDYLNALPGPRLHELGAAAARAQGTAMRALADVEAGPIAVRRDLTMPGAAGVTIPLRLYDPRDTRLPGPALLFLHGGGFVLGDLDIYEPVCTEIARTLDLPVIAVDYRLAPEHPFPAATDDCEAAARWVAAQGRLGAAGALGRAITSLVVAGDSAGGNLAIVTALALRDTPAAVPVIAQWPIYPTVDIATRHASFELFRQGYLLTDEAMAWFSDSYAADPADRRVIPLAQDQAGMPPTLVITAGLDPLRDQGRAYAAKCIAAGVPTIYREATGTIHGFITLRRAIPSAHGDLLGCLAVLKPMIAEAEADRVMAEAAR